MNLEGLSSDEIGRGLNRTLFTLEDQWILSILNRTIREISAYFTQYAFDKAAARAYEFFWNDLCAIYLETSKPVLFGKVGNAFLKTNKQKMLLVLLLNSIRLLHPITPFITEEIFALLKNKFPDLPSDIQDSYLQDVAISLKSPACIAAPYPNVFFDSDCHAHVEETFAMMYEMVRTIRNIRTEMQIPPSEKTDLYLCVSKMSREWNLADQHRGMILSLTPTANLIFSEDETSLFGASALWGAMKLTIPMPESFKAKEKKRLEKEKEKLQKIKEGTEEKLANSAFYTRAPREVVEKLEQNLLQTQRQLEEIFLKIKSLWRS